MLVRLLLCCSLVAHADDLVDTVQGDDARPNIFVMLTDDQDDLLKSTSVQPTLMNRVAAGGVRFHHGFANHPVCCVSRSSLLTGRYSHNTMVYNNSAAPNRVYPGNCTSPEWATNMEPHALAVHLHKVGYRSLYLGKYLNNAHQKGSVPPAYEDDPFKYIPPGWSEWFGLQGNSKYYNYSVSNNGTREDHGNDYETDYFPLVLLRRAQKFLSEHTAHNQQLPPSSRSPFFLFMGTPVAHANFIPPPQYWNLSARGIAPDQQAPRTPNHNIVCEHCHLPLRHYTTMSDEEVSQSDDIWRRRLGGLAYVDDMLSELLQSIEKISELERTFLLYTADNGFHLGQWAQGFDKRQLYETDVRVPYFTFCGGALGCLRGVTLEEPVSHIDIAPTILDFARAEIPEYMDGRSFRPMLLESSSAHARKAWDPRVFVQYYGESYLGGANPPDRDFAGGCGNGIDGQTFAPGAPYPKHALAPSGVAYAGSPCDGWNNTYTCTRKVATPSSPGASMYCEFDCFHPVSMQPMLCDASQPEGTGEYYDMDKDPWQMSNRAALLSPEEAKAFARHLKEMRRCAGNAPPTAGGCRLPPLS